jgi:hypothetical protein
MLRTRREWGCRHRCRPGGSREDKGGRQEILDHAEMASDTPPAHLRGQIMRYLMMFVGLAGITIGGGLTFSMQDTAKQIGGLAFLLGAIWGAAGFAAEDIVSAIRKQRA